MLNSFLNILYCSLVHPVLKYRSILRGPQLSIDSLEIKRIQHKFLSFFTYVLKILCPPHDYVPICKVLNVCCLSMSPAMRHT